MNGENGRKCSKHHLPVCSFVCLLDLWKLTLCCSNSLSFQTGNADQNFRIIPRISYFSHHCDKGPSRNHVKQEGFVPTHSLAHRPPLLGKLATLSEMAAPSPLPSFYSDQDSSLWNDSPNIQGGSSTSVKDPCKQSHIIFQLFSRRLVLDSMGFTKLAIMSILILEYHLAFTLIWSSTISALHSVFCEVCMRVCVCVCTCVWGLCITLWVCAPLYTLACPCWSQNRTRCVLFHCYQPYCLTIGSLTELSQLESQRIFSGIYLSLSPMQGLQLYVSVTGFYVKWGDLISGPHTAEQVPLAIAPVPQPHILFACTIAPVITVLKPLGSLQSLQGNA